MNVTQSHGQITVNRKNSGVVFLLLDCPGKFNSLGTPVLDELTEALNAFKYDSTVKALVMMSGKPDTCIIGADLFEIRKAESSAKLQDLSRRGQELFDKVAAFDRPVVIAINGACLGGGLELALSAHWRMASDAII